MKKIVFTVITLIAVMFTLVAKAQDTCKCHYGRTVIHHKETTPVTTPSNVTLTVNVNEPKGDTTTKVATPASATPQPAAVQNVQQQPQVATEHESYTGLIVLGIVVVALVVLALLFHNSSNQRSRRNRNPWNNQTFQVAAANGGWFSYDDGRTRIRGNISAPGQHTVETINAMNGHAPGQLPPMD